MASPHDAVTAAAGARVVCACEGRLERRALHAAARSRFCGAPRARLRPPSPHSSTRAPRPAQDGAKRVWVESLQLPDCPVRYSSGRPRAPHCNGKSCNMNHALTTLVYPDYPQKDVPNNHVSRDFDDDGGSTVAASHTGPHTIAYHTCYSSPYT